MTDTYRCPDCGGSGRGKSFTRPDDPCRTCGGTGRVPAWDKADEQEKAA